MICAVLVVDAKTISVLRLSLVPNSLIFPLEINSLVGMEEMYFVSGNPISLSKPPKLSKAGICVVEVVIKEVMGVATTAS